LNWIPGRKTKHRSDWSGDPEWEKCRKRYAGSQVDFTGSGIPGEDGIGMFRSIKIKNKTIGPIYMHEASPKLMRMLVSNILECYSKLFNDFKNGRIVKGDIDEN
jgi:hypothetical protein|tara:strand:- start:2292 stop:2603 length:312 start_codon:yes stop_codon:yes gene_type:complete